MRVEAFAAVIVLAALAGAYCAGERAGRQEERLLANQVAIDSNNAQRGRDRAAADSAAKVAAPAVDSAIVLRKAFRPERDRVVIVDDSTVTVDAGPPVPVPEPLRPLISIVRGGDRIIRHDDQAITQLRAQVVLLERQAKNLEEAVRLRDERIRELEAMARPRFGPKVWAAIGAAATLVVVYVAGAITP